MANRTRPPETESEGARPADADRSLWHRVTADVKPLKRRDVDRATTENPAPHVPAEPLQTEPARLKPVLARQPAPPPKAPEPELAHGSAPSLDKRTLMRLRRGLLPVEGRIDLHGMTQDQAHGALDRYLAASGAAGRRCVLVITGKGYRPDGSTGVLRGAVPRWLNQMPNRERVLAFCHATPADGGEGALYVLLRRQRHRR